MNDRKVLGATKLRKRLQQLREDTGEILGVEQLGPFLLERMKRRFKKEVDPDGRGWPALEDSTLSRKKRDGSANRQKLWRTGSLYNAIQIIRGRNEGGFGSPTGAGFRIGVKEGASNSGHGEVAEYGRIHQRGLGITKRRFIGVGASDLRAVTDRVRKLIKQAVN